MLKIDEFKSAFINKGQMHQIIGGKTWPTKYSILGEPGEWKDQGTDGVEQNTLVLEGPYKGTKTGTDTNPNP